MKHTRTLIAGWSVLAAATSSGGCGLDGHDEVVELQQQIAAQLELAPDGTQISDNEISYDDGRFVITFSPATEPAPGIAAAPDCPSNWFCFYDRPNFVYPRGRLSDRGWQDLNQFGWSDRIESIHNNTTTRIEFDNHRDFGNPANGHQFDELNIFAAAAKTAHATVSRPNVADHVFRF